MDKFNENIRANNQETGNWPKLSTRNQVWSGGQKDVAISKLQCGNYLARSDNILMSRLDKHVEIVKALPDI